MTPDDDKVFTVAFSVTTEVAISAASENDALQRAKSFTDDELLSLIRHSLAYDDVCWGDVTGGDE